MKSKKVRSQSRKTKRIQVVPQTSSASTLSASARKGAQAIESARLDRVHFLVNEIANSVSVILEARVELESPVLNAPEHVVLCLTPDELEDQIYAATTAVEATFVAREEAALVEGARKAHQDLVDAIEALPPTTSAEEFVQWMANYMTGKGF